MDNIFDTHKALKEYFKTADGEAFYNESDAYLHGKKLEDKRVQHVKRDDYKIVLSGELTDENTVEEPVVVESVVEEAIEEKVVEETPVVAEETPKKEKTTKTEK